MAGEQLAAKRYAQAAFSIASERRALEQWAGDLDAVAALMSDPDASAFFTRGKAAFADRISVLDKALAGIDPLVLNLAKLLVRKNRTALAPYISRVFREMGDSERGIAHAHVRTAVALSDGEHAALARRLTEIVGQQVTVDLEIDQALIGGITARIGDTVIDGSTRGKLIALRRRLRATAG